MPDTAFSWSAREKFIAAVLAGGGSGNCSATCIPAAALGRYARQYSSAAPDSPGRLAAFSCQLNDNQSYVLLTDVPWTCAADYEAGYVVLIQAGVTPNDLTPEERARSVVNRQARPVG